MQRKTRTGRDTTQNRRGVLDSWLSTKLDPFQDTSHFQLGQNAKGQEMKRTNPAQEPSTRPQQRTGYQAACIAHTRPEPDSL
ncbi:hypothetical protein F511_46797 [Dorcoceras hygrometricum]|uniref:Uncharacterized protein n=1 Tax=Dorcoceras hygrometricum TaxID=472368 RepID=A0A2Z6ZZ39_9LAMI|nr:hypothetical protein F511_46797 [Dorcoceras hygrometricum]